jgi:hypothetical protein
LYRYTVAKALDISPYAVKVTANAVDAKTGKNTVGGCTS